MPLTSAIIDQREPDWIRRLPFGKIPTAVAMLEAGDLQATTDDGSILVVERKTPQDLLHSMRDNRLLPQIELIRQVTPWAYLVITGHVAPGADGKAAVNGVETGWAWASIQGILLTIQELGVGIVQALSEVDYEATVIRLGNRDRGTVRTAAQRDIIPLSTAESILSALPNIGLEKARAVLAHCGSAAWALDYLTDDTSESGEKSSVPGIGPGIKAKVRNALGLEPFAQLAVVTKNSLVLALEPGEVVLK